MKNHYGCPVQATVNTLSGKWKVQIVWHLAYGPKRFGELRRLLGQVSEKVLSAQLRELEAEQVVARVDALVVPPQVNYSLSPAGMQLLPALHLLCTWGTAHLGVPSRLPPLPELHRPV
jgi:DNA-binding HxlR family transcriptional regulator